MKPVLLAIGLICSAYFAEAQELFRKSDLQSSKWVEDLNVIEFMHEYGESEVTETIVRASDTRLQDRVFVRPFYISNEPHFEWKKSKIHNLSEGRYLIMKKIRGDEVSCFVAHKISKDSLVMRLIFPRVIGCSIHKYKSVK